jgi:hypothetical protein
MVTSAAERKAVAHLVATYGMSERRACKTIGSCRMTFRYASTRPDDGSLRERMKAIAHERRRFGYPSVEVLQFAVSDESGAAIFEEDTQASIIFFVSLVEIRIWAHQAAATK